MQDPNSGDAIMAENLNSNNQIIPHVNLDGPLKRLKTLAEVQATEATSMSIPSLMFAHSF
jgi:hypothetical protein